MLWNQMSLYLMIPTNHLDLESISSLNDGLKTLKNQSSLPVMTMSSFKLWQTISLFCLRMNVIDGIDETYDEFLGKCRSIAQKSKTFERLNKIFKTQLLTNWVFYLRGNMKLVFKTYRTYFISFIIPVAIMSGVYLSQGSTNSDTSPIIRDGFHQYVIFDGFTKHFTWKW